MRARWRRLPSGTTARELPRLFPDFPSLPPNRPSISICSIYTILPTGGRLTKGERERESPPLRTRVDQKWYVSPTSVYWVADRRLRVASKMLSEISSDPSYAKINRSCQSPHLPVPIGRYVFRRRSNPTPTSNPQPSSKLSFSLSISPPSPVIPPVLEIHRVRPSLSWG